MTMFFASDMLQLGGTSTTTNPSPQRKLRVVINIRRADPHNWNIGINPSAEGFHDKNKSKRTPMDFDFSTITANTGDYVEFHLIAGNKIHFMPNKDRKRWSITAGTAIAATRLYGLEEHVDSSRLIKEVTFFCELIRPATNSDPLPYNIGLVIVDDGSEDIHFPVFFDPKVQNGG